MEEKISKEELQKAGKIIDKLNQYYNSKVVGQPFLGAALLVAMITNGHILLESVPGLAKTTAANVMTDAVSGQFSRRQCTPDLIPSDIIGTQTYKLPEVFVVIATQNPVEQEGTYVLSEAQMDRFLLKVKLDYPKPVDEIEILNRIEADVFSESHAVAALEDVQFLQELSKRVYMDDAIKQYIVDIVQASRNTDKLLKPELAQYVTMGASTRAAISFMEVAKAVALMNGRSYCIPDDVKAMRYAVLRHRVMLNFAAVADGIKEETIIDGIIGAVKAP